MIVHLVDGTYELFRCWFGAPPSKKNGREVGAARALLRSLAAWLREESVTHVAVAFDHVIESFRNELFEGYKSSAGVEADLLSQFELAERVTEALGLVTWPMVEFEADDALASAAKRYGALRSVTQVRLCSPDKDLAQCVRGQRIVGWDRKKAAALDEPGVKAKFGVPPGSIPDWLALVGDDADGIPGLPRWGAKSAAAILAAYGTLDRIPDDPGRWSVAIRGADALAESLRQGRRDALLYRRLATLREDVPLNESLTDLEWKGADRKRLETVATQFGDDAIMTRVARWR